MSSIVNLLYGWHRNTDIWAQQRRTLSGWAHNPAKNLIRLSEDLSRANELKLLVVDVLADIVIDSANPLDLAGSLPVLMCEFYGTLDHVLTEHPSLKVSRFFLVLLALIWPSRLLYSYLSRKFYLSSQFNSFTFLLTLFLIHYY